MNLFLLYPDYVLLSFFLRVLCVLCGEKLFKLQCSEKSGRWKSVSLFLSDSMTGNGSLQLITTFIEVSFYLFSIKRINLMFEEHFIRDNQGYFPTGFVSLLFKRHITQTGPALHKGGYFFLEHVHGHCVQDLHQSESFRYNYIRYYNTPRHLPV